jgi:hypothetical protein
VFLHSRPQTSIFILWKDPVKFVNNCLSRPPLLAGGRFTAAATEPEASENDPVDPLEIARIQDSVPQPLTIIHRPLSCPFRRHSNASLSVRSIVPRLANATLRHKTSLQAIHSRQDHKTAAAPSPLTANIVWSTNDGIPSASTVRQRGCSDFRY